MKAFGVFEGGGAKGYAHIGALRAIEARGIELEAVAGSSIGAVIALLIAAGFSSDELFRTTEQGNSGPLSTSWIGRLDQKDWAAFEKFRDEYLINRLPEGPTKLGLFKLLKAGCSVLSAFYRHDHLFAQIWTQFGLTNASGFREWLDNIVREKLKIATEPILFRHLRIPLKVVAGDLLTGKMRVFSSGRDANLSAIDAAIASASYPLFFQPFPFQGSLFVDGGLLSNLPAWVFDDERLEQNRSIPTFGFRFVEAPLLNRPSGAQNERLSSFPSFFTRLMETSIFGSQELGVRGIEEYYAFNLAANIETLAFHEIEAKAADLIEAGRRGVTQFFDLQIGPSDPDEMEIILGVIANFVTQALDRGAKQKLSRLRAFVLIEIPGDFAKVAYSANAAEDVDDRLKIKTNSPGTVQCLTLKEPVLTFVPQISEAIRTSPVFKYEHGARPKDIVTVYAIPIFADPIEWSKESPRERSKPIAALVLDFAEDVRYLLQLPEFEDRITTYAQICGEYLRGTTVGSYGFAENDEREASELNPLTEAGFFISSRKPRSLFQDSETVELVEGIEARIRTNRGQDRFA
jgi:NTE family protein